MGRPVKWRRVDRMPSVLQFMPADGDIVTGEVNVLYVEEYEAVRLKDLEGLEQEECADRMEVSRPTFQRILVSAHQKIADSLVNAKGIRIAGGNSTRNVCSVRCLDCGAEWEESVERLTGETPAYVCPYCRSDRIVCLPPERTTGEPRRRHRHCQGGCRRRRWGAISGSEGGEEIRDAAHHDPD